MLDPSIYTEIQKAWADDQNHPHRGREKDSLPSLDSIKIIIENAFWASLKREEERPITFSLVLLDRDYSKTNLKAGRSQLIMTFDESKKLTVDALVKLAPAFNPEYTSLIVSRISGHEIDYEIWGALFFSPLQSLFEEIPVQRGNQIFSRPDSFTVTATSPGSLIISRANSQIGRLFTGKFLRAIPTPFNSRAMGNFLIPLIHNDLGYKNFEVHYWHLFRATLDYLLSKVSKNGHGAAIVIIPNDKKGDIDKFITNRIRFMESLRIGDLLIDSLKFPNHPGKTLLKLGYYKHLSERLSTLSQFSCIDGALIISGTFEVLAFGAKLSAAKWNGEVIIGPDGFSAGGNRFDHSILGTRHNSIINFIGEYPNAIAFVISQDGPIRGFAKKDEKTILCWPDCRVSMFL